MASYAEIFKQQKNGVFKVKEIDVSEELLKRVHQTVNHSEQTDRHGKNVSIDLHVIM